MGTPLTSELADFIAGHIDSVELLEILLLLRTTRRAWTARELATEMRTTEGSATARLMALSARGLVSAAGNEGGFAYSPADASVEATVGQLAAAYITKRYAIIDAIFTRPQNPARAFAEAFRLRKGDGNG